MFEQWGWGSGPIDATPPIRTPSSAESCRSLALRVSVELLADAVLGVKLWPSFVHPDHSTNDFHTELARFLDLLHRLVASELPRLRRIVRCESNERVEWSQNPLRGRVDAVASMRTSLIQTSSCTPQLWMVRRVERFADTPVNRLVACILRETEALLLRIMAKDNLAGHLLRRERSMVAIARRALHGFLAASPLGEIIVRDMSRDRLFAEAQRRSTELRRFESLLDWWHALGATHLAKLETISSENAMQDLSTQSSYEIVSAMGLVLAFRELFSAEPSDQNGVFAFRSPAGPVRIEFGAGVDRPYARRAWTAVIRLPRDMTVVIEARNKSCNAAADIAERLYFYCSSGKGDTFACLLTPDPSAAKMDMPNSPISWRPFLAGIAHGEEANPITESCRLVEELLARFVGKG